MGRWLDAATFGPQRRARHMIRQLEKLDRHDAKLRAAGLDPLVEWHRSRDPRRAHAPSVVAAPRSARGRRLLVILAVGAAVAGLMVWRHTGATNALATATDLRPHDVPPAGVGEHATRLGVPTPAPPGAGGYQFEHTQTDGTAPVTWDPCRPIHYVTSGSAPRGEHRVVAFALAEVSRLTGFHFISDGTTTEPAVANRVAYQPQRYGDRWAPVLIAWTSPRAVARLAGPTIGLGGGTAISWNHTASSYVSGIVYLDKPQFTASLRHSESHDQTRADLRAVVLHELGHLLGLAHVSDPGSVMYPEAQLTVTNYSAGDRRGLHALSEGSCAPQL